MDFIGEDDPEAAQKFGRVVMDFIYNFIAQNPHAAPADKKKNTRVKLISKYRHYKIVYRIHDEHIEIVRLLHTSKEQS
jgi:plasmid stabilization system protein ParE